MFWVIVLLAAVVNGQNCLEDLAGGSIGCTANDLNADVQLVRCFCAHNESMACIVGENVTANLKVQLSSTSNQRYDVGVIVANDGGDALTGRCTPYALFNASVDNLDLNVTSGHGPFYNGELATGDICGDIRKSDPDVILDLGNVTFPCQDTDADNIVNLAFAIVWSQSSGAIDCTSIDTLVAGTGAKCDTLDVNLIGITVLASQAPTSLSPTSLSPTSLSPSSATPTSKSPTSSSPTSASPTSSSPTSSSPTSSSPSSASPTSKSPSSATPTSESPTSSTPTSASPTSKSPSSATPTSESPTSLAPTSESPTSFAPTLSPGPTTLSPTSLNPTTIAPTSEAPTSMMPTTIAPTSMNPTTIAPTSLTPTSIAPSSGTPTTVAPSSANPTSNSPTSIAPTSGTPTTVSPTSLAPTSLAPTSLAPTSLAPTTVFVPTTVEPTLVPTVEPTTEPTAEPTAEPTIGPTIGPTTVPTTVPTNTSLVWILPVLFVGLLFGITCCCCCCRGYKTCTFDLHAHEYPFKVFRNSQHGVYTKTTVKNSDITLTRYPRTINVFSNGSYTDYSIFYTQTNGLVAIQVCNNTYNNQLFLVYHDGHRSPVGFYEGLWVFKGENVSFVSNHNGDYIVSVAGIHVDENIDPIYLHKTMYRYDNTYKRH